MTNEWIPDGDILGLNGTINGRKCSIHEVCGCEIAVISLIRLKWCSITFNRQIEPAIKAAWICFCVEPCTVGFLSRAVVLQAGAKETYHDEFTFLAFGVRQS
jgi:hypothetical protein